MPQTPAMHLEDTQQSLTERLDRMRQLSASAMLDTDIEQLAIDNDREKLEPMRNFEQERVEERAEHDAELLAQIDTEESPPFLSSITSMFELENPISAFVARENLPMNTPVDGYNPLSEPGEIEGYEKYASYFAGSNNPEVTATIKRNIDRERYNREIVSRTSGWVNLISGVASGMGDPITLGLLLSAPAAGAASMAMKGQQAMSVGKTLTYGLGIGVAHTAVNEVLLHQIQFDRTLEESALNLTASVLLDSIVGGAVVARHSGGMGLAHQQVKDYFRRGGRVDMTDEFDTPNPRSMGAAEATGTAAEIVQPKGFLGIKAGIGKVALAMAKITPIGRTMQSSNPNVREVVQNLAETNYRLQGEGEDIANYAAESLIKSDYAHARNVINEVGEIQKRALRENGMSPEEFNAAIDYAQRRGDIHEDPMVQEAAQKLRVVLETNWKRAQEFNVKGTVRKIEVKDAQGNITETRYEPVDQNTAKSYQSRVYDTLRIDKESDEFIASLTEGYRDANIRRNQKIDDDVTALKAEDFEEISAAKSKIAKGGEIDSDIRIADNKLKSLETSLRTLDKFEGRQRGLKQFDDSTRKAIELGRKRDKADIKNVKSSRKELIRQKAKLRKQVSEFDAKIKGMEAKKQFPDDSDLDSLAQSHYESVANLKAGDVHFNAGSRANIMKHRVDIQDKYVEPWLQKDWEKRINQQVMTLAPRARLAQKFGGGTGDIEMSEVLSNIEQSYLNKIVTAKADGNVKAEKLLRKQMKSDKKDLETMRNRLLGRIAGADPESVTQSLGRSMLNFNSTRMLNGMMLSSIPEPGKIIARYGMGRTITAMRKNFKSVKLNDLPKEYAARMASASYRAQNARGSQMTDLFDTTPTQALEKATNRLSQLTYKFSGQQHFDSHFKGVAGSLSSDGFARSVRSGNTADLRKMGLDDAQIRVAQRELKKHGEIVDGLYEPRVELWDLRSEGNIKGYRPNDLRDAYDAMIVREADTLMVQPGVGDRPVFMDDMGARMIFQFKSFILGATNRTLVPMLQGSNTEMAKIMAYQSGLALMGYVLYSAGAGREIDWDDNERLIKEVMNRGGYTGYAMELMDMIDKATGRETSSRYKSRDKVGAMLGPTFGTINELLRAVDLGYDENTGKANVDVDGRVGAMRKLLPFQNHWAIRRMLDKSEGEISKALGGEGRKGEF